MQCLPSAVILEEHRKEQHLGLLQHGPVVTGIHIVVSVESWCMLGRRYFGDYAANSGSIDFESATDSRQLWELLHKSGLRI